MKVIAEMMVRTFATLILSLISILSSFGQELIPMGTWRTHFNYQETQLVEKTQSKIFAGTKQGLFFYDLEDQSLNKLSKIDGLSDVKISALKYNAESEYLAIGYESGRIDVITADGIYNLPVLYESNVIENKTINDISFYGELMNLSTDFGLLVLNSENQIREAYQNLGESGEIIQIRSSVVSSNKLYLASEEGVLEGSLENGDNLQDFNNWNRFSGSLVDGLDIIDIAHADNHIYAASLVELFKLSSNTWSQIPLVLNLNEVILKVRNSTTGLFILTNDRVISLNESDIVSNLSFEEGASVNDIFQEDGNTYWYADSEKGLSRLSDQTEHFLLNGPLSDINRLKVQSNEIYAFPTINTDYTGSLSNDKGYSVFRNGSWVSFEPTELKDLTNISDVILVNGKEIISSFGRGIFKTSDDLVYNYTNSPLQELEVGTENTLVSGLVVDGSGSIWLSNFNALSLYQWDGNEDWKPYDFGSLAASEPTSISINSSDQIWMILGLNNGFGALGYDIESDASRYITTTATQLPSNQVNDIAFGQDNEIWFATDLGLAYFPFNNGVIEDHSIDVVLPLFEGSVLFENKNVLSLALDGGNRLWVGTEDGLWQFGEDISELLNHFNEENSPLPSNKVLDLDIHPKTGEIFVNTDHGMVSYRTDGSESTNIHQQVSIFPNPVLPNYSGWVGLSGLANNVGIKITTVSGQMVREINAAGGSASWDIKDYTGQRVNAGVYLVFSSSTDGSETFVGKLAVID